MDLLALQPFQKPAILENSRMIVSGYRKMHIPKNPDDDPMSITESSGEANDPKELEWQDHLLFEITPCPFFAPQGATKITGAPPVDIPYPFTLFRGDLTQNFNGNIRTGVSYDFVIHAGKNYHYDINWLLFLPGQSIPEHYSQELYNVRVTDPETANCKAAVVP